MIALTAQRLGKRVRPVTQLGGGILDPALGERRNVTGKRSVIQDN